MAIAKNYGVPITRPEAQKLVVLANKFEHILDFYLDRDDKDDHDALIDGMLMLKKIATRANKTTKKNSIDEIQKNLKTIEYALDQHASGNPANFADARAAVKQLVSGFDQISKANTGSR